MNTSYFRDKGAWEQGMLRNAYAYGTVALHELLAKFDTPGTLVDVKAYRMLTPDSFIWRLRMADGVYYLYAEDFVPSLEHVRAEISEVSGNKAGHFIRVKVPKPFESLSAVKMAEIYKRPEGYDAMMPYVSDSGPDLVFLYKLDEADEDE